MNELNWGWREELSERKQRPGQPVLLNFAPGGLVVPLTKAGNLERGITVCVKWVHNVFTYEHFNLGNHQSERCLVGKNVDICHVPGTVFGFLYISFHLIFKQIEKWSIIIFL